MSNSKTRFNELYQQAQILIGKGYRPIPCHDKKPVGEKWNIRTREQEKKLWEETWIIKHTNNIGIRTANICIIDVEKSGLEFFNKLTNEYEAISAPKQYTARGGLHYYFANSTITPGVKRLKFNNKPIDIDVLTGSNKQALIYPSTFAGGKYLLEHGLPDILELPEMPKWFHKMWEWANLTEDALGLIVYEDKDVEIVISDEFVSPEMDSTRQKHIIDLFEIIPISVWDNRDTWIKAVYLVKYNFDEEKGLQLLNKYCGESINAYDGDQEEAYNGLVLSGNYQVGVTWLMTLAGSHNNNGFKKVKKVWEAQAIWRTVIETVDEELLWTSMEETQRKKIKQGKIDEDMLEPLDIEIIPEPIKIPNIMNPNHRVYMSDLDKIRSNLTKELAIQHICDTVALITNNSDPYWLVKTRGVEGTVEFVIRDMAQLRKTRAEIKDSKYSYFNLILMMEKEDRIIYSEEICKPFGSFNPIESRVFNSFGGFKAQISDVPVTDIEQLTARIRKHLLDVISNGNQIFYRYLMGWFARIVQRPHEKTCIVPVICGKGGAGKSTLFIWFSKEIIGATYGKALRVQSLVDHFNSMISKKVFIVLDELPIGFFKRDTELCAFKELITAPDVNVELKGKEPRTEVSYHNFVIISNSETLVKWDRRFFGTVVSPKYANDTEYFKPLREDYANKEVARAFYLYLMNWKDDWNCDKPPVTSYSMEQKIDSLSFEQKFIINLLEESHDHLWEKGTHCSKHRWIYRDRFTKQGLYSQFLAWLSQTGNAKIPTKEREFISQAEGLIGPLSTHKGNHVYNIFRDSLLVNLRRLLKINILPFSEAPTQKETPSEILEINIEI